jgi:hypothetical protein
MDRKFVIGSIVVPVVIAVVGWFYFMSPSPHAESTITNVPNNAGIVMQGQSGNNTFNMPAQQPPPPSPAINPIAALIAEGQNISGIFIKTNDPTLLYSQYAAWALKVDEYLKQTPTLGPAYAVQFEVAQPISTVRDGMNFNAAETWQKLQGQLIALSQFLTELRRN